MQRSWKAVGKAATIFFLLLGLSSHAAAADPNLIEELKRQQVTFAALTEAARAAQYVLVGEDHGVAESAQFNAALFEDLASHGFTAMAIENGPAVTEAIGKALRQKEPQGALAALVRDYPDSVAFYNWKENAVMLDRVSKAGGKNFAVWGIDQELMGAAKLVLEQIFREPLNASARKQVKRLLANEKLAYAKAAGSGNPTEHFMMTIGQEELRTLRKSLSHRALSLLDGLIESREIYSKSMSGSAEKAMASNVQRNLLMKRTLAARLSVARNQKVLVQIGASHAYKGINNLGNREIGNYLAEKAEGDGLNSLHILVLPASGSQSRFAGTARPFQSGPIKLYTDGFQPMVDAATGRSGPVLFDLRPLRHNAHTLADSNMQVERILLGFDFAVVLTDVHAMQALP